MKKSAVILISVIAIISLIFLMTGRKPEDTAKEYVESMLKGDAKKMVSLMSDTTIEELPYETEKMLIHATKEQLSNTIENYKNKYGKKWKYKVKIIDTYVPDFSKHNNDVEVRDVAISVKHKGKGWLKEKEGTEDIVIRCIKQGRKWYVLYADNM